MFKRNGMTLMEVLIVTVVIGILITIAIPTFTTSLNNTRRDSCINNLIQLNLAKEQWALENNLEPLDDNTPTAEDLDSYIRDGTASLICPLDTSESFSTSYSINEYGVNPTCKIMPSTHTLQQSGD